MKLKYRVWYAEVAGAAWVTPTTSGNNYFQPPIIWACKHGDPLMPLNWKTVEVGSEREARVLARTLLRADKTAAIVIEPFQLLADVGAGK